jgi:NitT/TauT family transport system ATP-binding protein
MEDIILEQVSFSYDDKQVLQDLDMAFAAGQVSVLMGRSGVGKTTIFRLLTGLIKPDQGRICGLPEEGAGVLFQEDRLFPYLTVLDNLKLCVPERSEAELRSMLEELGLGQKTDQMPGELSGGMRRRVALVRAAAAKRELYLLDEPFNGLDEATKEKTALWLKEKLAGKTAIVISHQAEDAEMLGGNILRLEEKEV